MFIYGQLSGADKRLRLIAAVVGLGICILVFRLLWLQVFAAREYLEQYERQAVRTVRIPSARGLILDRNGHVLADNAPSFDISIYLEELRGEISAVYRTELARVVRESNLLMRAVETQYGRRLSSRERARFRVSSDTREKLRAHARVVVVSNLVSRISELIGVPLTFDEQRFEKHYLTARPLPFVIASGVDQVVVARFSERGFELPGVDLDLQLLRVYPRGVLASHVIGHLTRDQGSAEGEDAFYNYPMWTFRGVVGVEAGLDSALRGKSGVKYVILNSMGYKEGERIVEEAVPGSDVELTIDLEIQSAAEQAISRLGSYVRGAIVVMDCNTGEILALVSRPAFDPNVFIRGITPGEWRVLSDPNLRPLLNRATQVPYPPGSVFKIVTALGILESGIDPNQKIYNPPSPTNPRRGCIKIGRRVIHDTAPPGEYDFVRGFIRSSNTYFITNGLKVGIERILSLARQLGFGEKVGLPTRQEVGGVLPSIERVRYGWSPGDTANVCIGQGPVAVTPIQVAVMTAAIANGGKVLRPKLVRRVVNGARENQLSSGVEIRRVLQVRAENLELIRHAMVADVEDPEGTAYAAFHPDGKYALGQFRVGGKTGTAEVEDSHGRVVDHIVWFTSFAPVDRPRYVVVVLVESGQSGGATCAPIARDVYSMIEQIESRRTEGASASASLAMDKVLGSGLNE